MDEERQEQIQEEYWFTSAMASQIESIGKLNKGYSILINICKTFKLDFPRVDDQLNNYFIKIYRLIEPLYDSIQDHVDKLYNQDSLNNMPDHYINTNILEGYIYYPFDSLHAAKKELLSRKISWSEVEEKMDECSTRIEKAYYRVVGDEHVEIKDDEFLKIVGSFTIKEQPSNNDFILNCGSINLNLRMGQLRFGNNPPLREVSVDSREIKFLKILLQHQDNVIRYETIASLMNLSSYHEGMDNNTLGEEMRYFKRDLTNLLIKSGMKKDEINNFIKVQKNEGYMITCPKA